MRFVSRENHPRHRNQTQLQLLMLLQMEKQMPHTPKPRQFDLFASPQKGEGACPPPWELLPAQTRQNLTTLMARLILDHGANARADKETACDDV